VKRTQISDGQFFFIIFVSITSLTFFSVPTRLVPLAKQDLWLSMLLGLAIDVYVAYILFWIGRKYAGKSLVQYSGQLLGWAGKAIGLVYLLFFFAVSGLSLWIFSQFLTNTLMPETPEIVFTVTMIVLAGWAAVNGLEVIARLAQLIAVLILLASLFILLASMPNIQLNYLLPQFEDGFGPALKGAIYPGSWFGICVMMGMLMPHHANQKRTFRLKALAVLLGTFIMTMLLMYTIVVMGPEMAGRMRDPIYIFSRITHAAFLERFDVLLMLIYITGAFITLSTLYYCLSEGAAQLFGSKSHRGWVYALAVPLTVFTLMLPFRSNPVIAHNFFGLWFPLGALLIEGGLTTFLFVCAFIKDRVRRKLP